MQDATAKYNQNKQKKLTCDYIGSVTENAKNNLEYIGDQANQTTQTIGSSTIQPPITKTQENNS